MKDLLKVMKALSDSNRIKIVKMLQRKEMCVCELRFALQIAQPTVSKHLKVLEEAGIVDRKKDGIWVNYILKDNIGDQYSGTIIDHLKTWLEDDPVIRELTEKLPDIRRENICN